jgi:hypothetical protein
MQSADERFTRRAACVHYLGELMQLHFEVGDVEYLKTCARIRNISIQALMRRLVDAITEDHLVQSILDDADDMASRRKGEHRYREASHDSRDYPVPAPRQPKPRPPERVKADGRRTTEPYSDRRQFPM